MTSKDPTRFALPSILFSYEPYGFMVRRNDAAFRLAVNRALAGLYRSGDIAQIYDRWFGTFGKPSPAIGRCTCSTGCRSNNWDGRSVGGRGSSGDAPKRLRHSVFSLDTRHPTLFLLTAFEIAAGSLHVAGIVIGLVPHRWPVGRLALRAAGSFNRGETVKVNKAVTKKD